MSYTDSQRRRRNKRTAASNHLWWRRYRSRMDRGLERCRLCDSAEELTFEHLKHHAEGGGYTLDNVTILCRPCNLETGRGPDLDLPSLAEEERRAPHTQQWSRIPVPGEVGLTHRPFAGLGEQGETS